MLNAKTFSLLLLSLALPYQIQSMEWNPEENPYGPPKKITQEKEKTYGSWQNIPQPKTSEYASPRMMCEKPPTIYANNPSEYANNPYLPEEEPTARPQSPFGGFATSYDPFREAAEKQSLTSSFGSRQKIPQNPRTSIYPKSQEQSSGPIVYGNTPIVQSHRLQNTTPFYIQMYIFTEKTGEKIIDTVIAPASKKNIPGLKKGTIVKLYKLKNSFKPLDADTKLKWEKKDKSKFKTIKIDYIPFEETIFIKTNKDKGLHFDKNP